MTAPFHVRIARPTADLSRSERMYRLGLGLSVLARFEDHHGFDGVMLGCEHAHFHLEFTHCREHPSTASPSVEDLVVWYVPSLSEWRSMCGDMLEAGFRSVASFNPYWELHGSTFEDPDGYRVVLWHGEWTNADTTIK
jgi:hypothetical protein